MRALTSLDSMFLATEDGRTNANVSSLAIMDRCNAEGNPLTRSDIQDLFAERLHLLPPLRWRLVDVPLGLGHPWWVDQSADVDLDFHIRETTMDSPGDHAALEVLAARLSARPMDRSRPLWEVYLIHGLQQDRVAVLTKLHHATVDGLSGGEVLDVLFDATPQGRDLTPQLGCPPEQQPGRLAMLTRTATELPRRQHNTVAAAARALAHLDQIATLRPVRGLGIVGRTIRRVTGARPVLDTTVPAAPRLRFNGRITARRRVALTSLSLDDVKEIKNHHGATVNDVVVALCAGALRRWLTDQGALPDRALVAAIPVSVRAQDEFGTYGNKIGTMMVTVPTDEADPEVRLRQCHTGLRTAKERHHATPASLMCDANDLIPPVLFAPAVRATTGAAASNALRPAANLVISNVPGSRTPLYCTGRRIREHYPVSMISDSLGLNLTVFSYTDRLEIGLVGDRDSVSDLPGLADAFGKELLDLKATVK
jgi:WS/DGAT/MGAT family acyltransferase